MNRKWLFLLVYYAILPFLPLGDIHLTFLTLLAIAISLAFVFLYHIIGDEILFYTYNFIAIIGLVFSLWSYNPYSPLTLAIAYGMLGILFMHILYSRFLPMFGTVRSETVIYTLLSIVIGFFSVYLFLIYPIGYGFSGVIILMVLIIILTYFLMRSSKPKNRSDAT